MPSNTPAKRKRKTQPDECTAEVVDLTRSSPQRQTTPTAAPAPAPAPAATATAVERRAKRFRSHAPASYLERHRRAVTQRMFIVRQTATQADEAPVMQFAVVGSTGNLYETTIGKVPSCSCPDSKKGNQCKHIIYVLSRVLKVPAHLQYQLAFLSCELREIYQKSSLGHDTAAAAAASSAAAAARDDHDGSRKPVQGDCPVCFMEFEPAHEEIVWCRAQCGQNIHKVCFERWAASQRQSGGVRCVYCRSPWLQDSPKLDTRALETSGFVNEEGYVNVGEQFGLPEERDHG